MHLVPVPFLIRLPHHRQPAGIGERQRPQQHFIDGRKDRNRGADAEREREDCSRREAGRPPERAAGDSCIADERRDHLSDSWPCRHAGLLSRDVCNRSDGLRPIPEPNGAPAPGALGIFLIEIADHELARINNGEPWQCTKLERRPW